MSSDPFDTPVSNTHSIRSYAGILRWGCLALSVAFFVISLFYVGFYTGDQNPPEAVVPGYFLILIGWLGIADGLFAWYANPALLIAWVTMGFWSKRYVSLKFSLIAVGVALSFLLNRTVMAGGGGGRHPIVGYGTGYVFWIISMVMALCGSVAGVSVIKLKKRVTFDDFDGES